MYLFVTSYDDLSKRLLSSLSHVQRCIHEKGNLIFSKIFLYQKETNTCEFPDWHIFFNTYPHIFFYIFDTKEYEFDKSLYVSYLKQPNLAQYILNGKYTQFANLSFGIYCIRNMDFSLCDYNTAIMHITKKIKQKKYKKQNILQIPILLELLYHVISLGKTNYIKLLKPILETELDVISKQKEKLQLLEKDYMLSDTMIQAVTEGCEKYIYTVYSTMVTEAVNISWNTFDKYHATNNNIPYENHISDVLSDILSKM